jgi:hypothetical protein
MKNNWSIFSFNLLELIPYGLDDSKKLSKPIAFAFKIVIGADFCFTKTVQEQDPT